MSHASRALRHRNFKLFFFCHSISVIVTWMTRLATRLAIGIENALAHTIVDRLLGFVRPFAEAVAESGLVFVGPSPEAIRLMGDKSEATRTAKRLGIPVVPGSDGGVTAEDDAMAIAKEIGFPLLVKAAAGGGGRGMKVAQSADDLMMALSTASNEAKTIADYEVRDERRFKAPEGQRR